jgi:hypothetical protein
LILSKSKPTLKEVLKDLSTKGAWNESALDTLQKFFSQKLPE